MAKRTLASCWKQYEKLSLAYLNDQKGNRAKILTKLDTLTRKTNADRIGAALFTLFVHPYTRECASVEFSNLLEDEEKLPSWYTSFDKDTGKVLLHPVNIFRFIKELKNFFIPENNKEEDFLCYRHACFSAEISKLNSTHVLFILILQRVAYLLKIAHLEKRGGVIEVAEDENYHTMLWAFKELEKFLQKTYGIHIRSHYGILWYESDWITGK